MKKARGREPVTVLDWMRWAERRLAAAPDHPVSLAFPEGEYLKGLLCQV